MGKVLSISEKFITAAEGNDEVVLKVTGMVGMDFTGMALADAVEFYQEQAGKDVRIELDSVGGFVSDAFAFYDQVRVKGLKVAVDGYGMVASAATIIMAAAGKKRSRLSPNAEYLVHNASGGDAESLERANKKMATIYSELTGKTDKDMRAMMKEDKPMSAQEAKKRGFVGEVMELQRLAAQHKEDMADTKKVKRTFAITRTQAIGAIASGEVEIEVDVDAELAAKVGELTDELKDKTKDIDELKGEVDLKNEAITAKKKAEDALKAAEEKHLGELDKLGKEIEGLKAEIERIKTKPVDGKVKPTANGAPTDKPGEDTPAKLTAETRDAAWAKLDEERRARREKAAAQ